MDATNHNHRTYLEESQPYLISCAINPTVYTGEFTAQTINGLIDNYQTMVFASRSHATRFIDEATNEVLGTCLRLNNDDSNKVYYYSSTSMASLELSNASLVLFIGCETAFGGENASNLVSVAVAKGAETAIGFEANIDCTTANKWTKAFFSKLANGKTVQQACDELSDEDNFKNTSLASPVICGNKSNKLEAVF